MLVHGEGDALGEPVRLEPFERFILNRIYEYDPETGRLLHDRVLIITGKGNSKTEGGARIAVGEAAGPFAPLKSPRVRLSAASYNQNNELFEAATLSITGTPEHPGPLAPRFQKGLHLLDTRILIPDARRGRIERIAAVGGTNDGGKETCRVGDEVQEWTGLQRERQYTVVSKSLRKRRVLRPPARPGGPLLSGSLDILITTPGDDPTVVTEDPSTLLGKLYRHGVRVAKGEIVDPGFLFLCWEADDAWNLDDPEQLRQAILEANPAAGSPILDIESKVRSYHDPTVLTHEFRRYDLAQWSAAPDSWLELKTWQDRIHPKGAGQPPAGTEIGVGFDGSKSRDLTAIWGCTMAGHLFKIEDWERPPKAPADWTVSHTEVDAKMSWVFRHWKVRLLEPDVAGWEREVEDWEKRWPNQVVRFETEVYARFAPAVGRFRNAVVDDSLPAAQRITHDGDTGLAHHIANARTKETRWGLVITKEHKDSPRRIDRAVAAVNAFDAITAPVPKVDRTVRSWS